METNNIIIKQTLQKGFEDSYLIAEKYYKVIAVINDLATKSS
jgi:hypothetical protein